jgi:hypothetical protein
MIIFLGLEEVVAATTLVEEARLNGIGVVADEFGGVAHCVFVEGDERGVLGLFVGVDGVEGLSFCEFALEVEDFRFC